jgi:hypothetical protein
MCTKFALVLESKNWTQNINFEQNFDQVTVMIRGEKSRVQNPVKQAQLQATKLKSWLEEHKSADIPVHYLFVNTNEKSVMISEDYIKNACNSEVLIDKINQLVEAYNNDNVETRDLRKMKKLLLENHTPDNPDILKEYDIPENEILTGVRCPKNGFLPMKYKFGYWCCTDCTYKSKTAHYEALQDYSLLIKPTITNRELRRFLHVDSIRIAGKILSSMNLVYTGTFKDRTYELPSPLEIPLSEEPLVT